MGQLVLALSKKVHAHFGALEIEAKAFKANISFAEIWASVSLSLKVIC